MKILILNYEYPPIGGGSSVLTKALAGDLANRGHEVTVLTSHFKNLPRHEKNEIETIRVPSMRRYQGHSNILEMISYAISATIYVRKNFRNVKFDLVHFHFVIPTGLIVLLTKKILHCPIVLTVHGSDVPGHDPSRLVSILHFSLRPIWKKIIRSCAHIVGPSNFICDLLKKSINVSNVSAIANFVKDVTSLSVTRKNKVLLASRLVKMKRIDVFLNCLKSIDFNWEIDILGRGPDQNRLEELASSLKKNITFRGWVDRESKQYDQYFQEAKIFVLLSKSENFPIVLLDAMQNGLAIIASDIPGNREVLGDAALYVNPDDENEVSQCLKKLLFDSNLCQKYANRGLQRIKKNFTERNITDQYHDLFRKLTYKDGNFI